MEGSAMRFLGFKIVSNGKKFWVKFGFLFFWFRVSKKMNTLSEARDQKELIKSKFIFNGFTKTIE